MVIFVILKLVLYYLKVIYFRDNIMEVLYFGGDLLFLLFMFVFWRLDVSIW